MKSLTPGEIAYELVGSAKGDHDTGVTVAVADLKVAKVVMQNGVAKVTALAAGSTQATFSKSGYKNQTLAITVVAPETLYPTLVVTDTDPATGEQLFNS